MIKINGAMLVIVFEIALYISYIALVIIMIINWQTACGPILATVSILIFLAINRRFNLFTIDSNNKESKIDSNNKESKNE